MVSYPDDSGIEMSSTLSAPFRSSSRAPSVASTSARSAQTVRASRQKHRHAYSKSYAGVTNHSSTSSSHAPLNEFPTFERTGDVDITITSGRKESKYILHKLYLAQCSEWFDDVLDIDSNEQAPSPSSRLHTRASQRVHFELDRGSEDAIPMLILKPSASPIPEDHGRGPPRGSKPRPPSSGFFRSMSNFSALHMTNHPPDPADEVLQTYDNLFRIFYNHEPILDRSNIAVAYTQCKVLLQLASAYEALDVIGPRVDHHLLRFGSRLWKQIAKYPPSYLKLGYLARSRAIFSEALVHVVGQWPAGESALRGQVPPEVLDLVDDKVDYVEEQRQKVDSKLWRLTLTTSRGERVAPGVSWLDWLVMSLWRQWYAENTTPAPASILKDSSQGHSRPASSSGNGHPRHSRSNGVTSPQVNLSRVFRLLGAGGQSYLNHDEMKKFLKLTPELYSRDNLKRAERRLDEIKNLARDVVQPLTRNFLELDTTRDGGVSYLTCVRVTDQELPW